MVNKYNCEYLYSNYTLSFEYLQIILDNDTPTKPHSDTKYSYITPPNKNPTKRGVSSLDTLDLSNMDFSPESVTKMPKNSPNDHKE